MYPKPKQRAMTDKLRQVRKFILTTCKTDIIIDAKTITSSGEIADVLKLIHAKEGNDFQEHFYCLFLNRCNRITGYYFASMGGVAGTVADPRLIIKTAALADCCSMILCHNHPSGSLIPSRADEDLTRKIKEACKYFDITVLDHVIISEEGYYSFADDGLI